MESVIGAAERAVQDRRLSYATLRLHPRDGKQTA